MTQLELIREQDSKNSNFENFFPRNFAFLGLNFIPKEKWCQKRI